MELIIFWCNFCTLTYTRRATISKTIIITKRKLGYIILKKIEIFNYKRNIYCKSIAIPSNKYRTLKKVLFN